MNNSLSEKRCVPCEGGVPPLSADAIKHFLNHLKDWKAIKENTEISRVFNFKNFYHTMAFVNAIAWIANQENHHPDLEIGYNYCHVRYKTHAINSLSENDFICAAKIDALVATAKGSFCSFSPKS